jgi:hypothetical protein
MHKSPIFFLVFTVAVAGLAVPARAGQILYEASGTCYISGCNEINTVASNGGLTPFASVATQSLATDSQGNVYAVVNGEVLMYAPNGTTTIVGASADSLGMAFDSAGNLYTTNDASGTIREYAVGQYDPNNPDSNWYDVAGISTNIVQTRDVAFDAAGNIYIASNGTGEILKATPDGNPVPGSPIIGYNTPTPYISDVDPWGLAFDSAGNLYVADTNNDEILEYSSTGSFIKVFASAASTANLGAYALSNPSGIAFDASGDLFVASNSRVRFGYTCGLTQTCTTSILEFTPDGADSVYASTGLEQTEALAFSSAGTSTPEPRTTLLFASGALVLLSLGQRRKGCTKN